MTNALFFPSLLAAVPRAARNRFLRKAREMRMVDVALASGRCLALTLALCDFAKRAGIRTELVVWHVKGDPDFCDHWALGIGDSCVIDLTRVQVDGQHDLVWNLSDYPSHFLNPRCYPDDLIQGDECGSGTLDALESTELRLNALFCTSLRRSMLRHDLSASLAQLSVMGLLGAWYRFGIFNITFWLQRLQASMVCRKHKLWQDECTTVLGTENRKSRLFVGMGLGKFVSSPWWSMTEMLNLA